MRRRGAFHQRRVGRLACLWRRARRAPHWRSRLTVLHRAVLRELGPGVPGAGHLSTGSFEPRWAKKSACSDLVGGPIESTDRASQHPDQPIDRDHQNVLLKPLDAACANQADHWHRAASAPPPTPARQPRRLFAHPSDMAIVVCPRFRLDPEPDAGRRDRQRVDVPSSSPPQRVPLPPPLRLKRRKHTPDLVLGASAHAAALGERQPMPGVEPEPECEDENGAGRRERPRARDSKRQQQGGAARRRRDSGSRQPLVSLAARVVQARPSPMRCSSCLPNHRGDVPTASGRSNDPPALAFDRPD